MSQKTWLSLTILFLIANLGLVGIAYLQLATRDSGSHFEVLPSNETKPLVALARPNVSIQALLSWVTLAATATFTFDFVHVDDQLQNLKDYFTKDGYDSFLASLENNGMLSTIQDKKLVLSAVAIGPAIVLTEEENGDKHSWRVQVPILVRYQSANVDETRTQIIEVLVNQVPTNDAPKGIGIAQYIAKEADPGAKV